MLRVSLENTSQPAQSEINSNSTSTEQCFICFEVQDTGVGIAVAEIDTLFNAFVQTEAGKKAADGTGLGLTITKKYVQIMEGNIGVSSIE